MGWGQIGMDLLKLEGVLLTNTGILVIIMV
jgi:hypothetical protein